MSFINEHVVISSPLPTHKNSKTPKHIKFDEEEEEAWLACYDANNLYGEAMCSLLPCQNFEWVDPAELESVDWYNIDTEGEDCFILKVDLHYPKEIHDYTLDLPLAASNETIQWDMLTTQQQEDYNSMCEQCQKSHTVCKNMQTFTDL